MPFGQRVSNHAKWNSRRGFEQWQKENILDMSHARILQRAGRRLFEFSEESNMLRIEVRHFASPSAPNFPVGENSGFMQEIL